MIGKRETGLTRILYDFEKERLVRLLGKGRTNDSAEMSLI